MTDQHFDIARFIGAVIGGLFAGALCGLLPLAVGKSRERTRLGVAGFLTCIICGGVLGIILALPVTIIFTAVILILGKPMANPPPPPSHDA